MEKIDKKKILIVLIILIILIIGGILIFNNCSYEKAGEIKEGKVIYSDKIITINKFSDKKIIEIKSVDKLIDSVIITTNDLKEMKSNQKKYNRSLKEVLKDKKTNNKDIYNIKKAIEFKLVTEDEDLLTYYAKITGLKNKKAFIKFCEDAFKLIEKDKSYD